MFWDYTRRLRYHLQTIVPLGLLAVLLLVEPAAAQDAGVSCDVPASFQPIINLLDAAARLLFAMGMGVGVVALAIAAVMIMLPGSDLAMRGKRHITSVIFGAIILFMASPMMDFVATQMGAAGCV